MADNIDITKAKNKLFSGFGLISIPIADLKTKTGKARKFLFFDSYKKCMMHYKFVYLIKQPEHSFGWRVHGPLWMCNVGLIL